MPPYVPQVWVDNTTPVDASHMQHVEDGLVVADANALAALARQPTYVERQFTNAEIRAMTTPLVIVPGVPGKILFPISGGLLITPGSIPFTSTTNAWKFGFVSGGNYYQRFTQGVWNVAQWATFSAPSSVFSNVAIGADLVSWFDSAIVAGDGTMRLSFVYVAVTTP